MGTMTETYDIYANVVQKQSYLVCHRNINTYIRLIFNSFKISQTRRPQVTPAWDSQLPAITYLQNNHFLIEFEYKLK